MKTVTNEPVVTYGTIGVLIGTLLAAWLRNYTDMPDDMTTAIVELVVFAVPIVIGLIVARSKVTPVAKLKGNDK